MAAEPSQKCRERDAQRRPAAGPERRALYGPEEPGQHGRYVAEAMTQPPHHKAGGLEGDGHQRGAAHGQAQGARQKPRPQPRREQPAQCKPSQAVIESPSSPQTLQQTQDHDLRVKHAPLRIGERGHPSVDVRVPKWHLTPSPTLGHLSISRVEHHALIGQVWSRSGAGRLRQDRAPRQVARRLMQGQLDLPRIPHRRPHLSDGKSQQQERGPACGPGLTGDGGRGVHRRNIIGGGRLQRRCCRSETPIATFMTTSHTSPGPPVAGIPSKDPHTLSIVLPVYDEEAVLGRSIERLLDTLREWKSELLVVDDGSRDGSADVARRWAERDARVRLVQLKRNQGKGAAVRAGLKAARGEWMLITDADLSTDPACANDLLNALGHGADLVFGSRRAQGAQLLQRQPRLREGLGRGFTALTNSLLGLGLGDLTCGFKALNRPTAEALLSCTHVDGWAFDVEWAVCARAQGLRLEEVPVRWAHQRDSKVRVGHAVLTSLLDLAQIWRRRRTGHYGALAPGTGPLRDRSDPSAGEPRMNGPAGPPQGFPLPRESGRVTIPTS
ncbi:MAG TPA: glycosyltransferase [Planctomycetes bacterium]|nr:glycosyltransferase [Planctomycetota bacterium]HIK61277.1 glycosyltransferase [Planctomycetota bacterium]